MKIYLVIFLMTPIFLFSQFENRTHINVGNNIQLTTNGYKLYDGFIIGTETILGLRIGKIFAGAGAGIQYTGMNSHILTDSIGNELANISVFNLDVPLFLDFTYGRKFYVEGKVGYSVKLSNIQDYSTVNTHTMFNTIGVGYSLAIGEKIFLDLAIEGKFNYLFINTISKDYTSIYFLPAVKLGFRFTNTLKD